VTRRAGGRRFYIVIGSPKFERPIRAQRELGMLREATERETSTPRSITDQHDDRSAERYQAIPEKKRTSTPASQNPIPITFVSGR
jgi:hypothetical protein